MPRKFAMVVAVTCAVLTSFAGRSAQVEASSGSTVWIQSFDSCQQAIGGATYQLNGVGYDVTTTTAPNKPVSYPRTSGTNCPIGRGNCAKLTNGTEPGCVRFYSVPPGVYRLHELSPPPSWNGGQSYALCTGGSACQGQWSTVTVLSDGTVSAATTNVYPDGKVTHYPDNLGGTFTAKQGDPIVTHSFGIGTGWCDAATDGIVDADDYLTGSPSSHCKEDPTLEVNPSMQPFPWSHTLAADPAY